MEPSFTPSRISPARLELLKIRYVSDFGEQWYRSLASMQIPGEQTVKHLVREMGTKNGLVALTSEG